MTKKRPTIAFDYAMFLRLKEATEKASAATKECFFFEGNQFYTPYAVYLVEYLAERFGDHHKRRPQPIDD